MPDCDVAVVGAGVIGTAITYELVARGASVTLLDCRGAGLGSTQAAAGMLVPYLEGFGRPLLPLATKSLEMYDAFVDRVSRDAGVGVGYRRTGSLQVVTADQPLDELQHIAADARAAGHACELLDEHAAREAEPQLTPEVSGALFMKSHGFVVTADLCGALTAARHQARRARAECRRALNASSIETATSAISLDNDTTVKRIMLSWPLEAGRGRSILKGFRRCR